MKNFISHFSKKSALVLLLVCNILNANAQQVFDSIFLKNIDDRKIIDFSVKREVNVFQYRIEATNDSNSFSPISILQSKGNTMLPRNYQFEIYTPLYKYYRVCMIGMNASMQYSATIITDYPPRKMDKESTDFKKSGTIVINKN